jgi:hypothetical protein
MTVATTLALHVRFAGRSEDLDMRALDLDERASDAELRAALAKRYDVAPAALDEYVVVREQQAVIVRPLAYYG